MPRCCGMEGEKATSFKELFFFFLFLGSFFFFLFLESSKGQQRRVSGDVFSFFPPIYRAILKGVTLL